MKKNASTVDWISQSDAARLRGVSRQSISDLVKRGRLHTVKVADRMLLDRKEVLAYKPNRTGRPPKKNHQQRP